MTNIDEAAGIPEERTLQRRQAKVRRRRARAPDAVPQQDDVEGDNGPETGLSHEEILRQITTQLSVEPVVAGAAFGLGRNASYQACKSGEIVTLRMGHKLTCPTAPLRRKLGMDPPLASDDPVGPPKPAPKSAAHLKKQETVKSTTQRRRHR